MRVALGISVVPDDLPCGVDAMCSRAADAQGIVEGGEGAPAVEEAVAGTAIRVTPEDLARVVDAVGKAVGSQGIVEGGVAVLPWPLGIARKPCVWPSAPMYPPTICPISLMP